MRILRLKNVCFGGSPGGGAESVRTDSSFGGDGEDNDERATQLIDTQADIDVLRSSLGLPP